MARTDEGTLVEAARSGDSQAFGQLFDAWFDRVHDLSRRIVKDPGTAGEVAQDAFLTAWTRLDSLQDPDAFGGWLLRIARNASLNRLAKERRSVALDHETMTTISDLDAPDHDPLANMDQAARIDLVWDAAAALGERDMSILDLHLRHGLGAPELAEELGTTANNAHQILFTLRQRLGTNVRALVLWRAGRPACDDLRRTLAAAGIATFDKQAVKAIERHAAVCDACNRERSDRLAPAALFGAAPVVAAPILLKAEVASALAAGGVPMGGSAALGGGSAPTSASGSGATEGSSPDGSTHDGSTPDGTSPDGSTAGGPTPGGPVAIGAVGHETPSTATAGVHDADDTEPVPVASRRNRLLAVAVVVLVLIGLVAVVAGGLDDPDDPDEIEEVATGTEVPATDRSGAEVTTTLPLGGATTTGDGGGELVVGEIIVDQPASPDAPPDDGQDPPIAPPPGATDPREQPTVPGTPPAAAPTTTASTTTSTTSTTAPAPAPEILRFTAVTAGFQCRGGVIYDLAWATNHADEVVVGSSTGGRQAGDPDGTAAVCAPVGAAAPTFLLVASGAGGDVQQIITGRSVIR